MGATQSIPSQVGGGQPPPTASPPRNKLTKPRTNSNTTRGVSCLPSLSLSLSRSGLLGGSKSSPAAGYQAIVEDQPSGSIFAIEYSQTAQPTASNRQSGNWDLLGGHLLDYSTHADSLPLNSMSLVDSTSSVVVSPTLVSSGMLRRGSMVTRSSTNSSSACASPPDRNSGIPSMGTVRRRSQLLAAPPATATRKPTKSYRNSMDISDISPDPFSLALPLENDIGRCTTPSGYSVLGAFKRGSLRIANGAASPAPSSCPGSPDASTRGDFFGSTFITPEIGGSRPSSRLRPIIVVPNTAFSVHEVRLVPPSPTDCPRASDEGVPGSPFSFMRSPSIYDDDDILDVPHERDHTANFIPEDLQPTSYGLTESCESLVSAAPSTTSTGVEYHRVLAEQCLNRRSDKPICTGAENSQAGSGAPNAETDEYHDVLLVEARKENGRRLRQPSMGKIGSESTDSGYSSSGSVNSWKTAQGDQHVELNPVARKLGNHRLSSKANLAPFVRVAEAVEEMDKKSRTKGMVAAIRRRYSQGDLKASARGMEFTKQPSVPTMPVVERRKTLTKFRPELKHRRSMVAVTGSAIRRPRVQGLSPAIAPVPPLPIPSRSERKGSFNLLTLEDYLPLVEDLPFTPIIDHTHDMASISFTDIETDTQESVIKIGVGRGLNRGSKITGQDYYQRFSRRQYARVETMIG